MAAAFVGGAALGAAFGELFRAVMEARDRAAQFRPQLELLNTTLTSVKSVIDEIEGYNMVLDRAGEMDRIKELMIKGGKLVRTCSKVSKLNIVGKHHYSRKLNELNESVREFFGVYFQAVIARDVKENLLEVKGVSQEVRRLADSLDMVNLNGMMQNGSGYFIDYLVPQVPDVVVGSEVGRCLKEIKEKLLGDGFSVAVVSAPGGCGKTTLVKALCHDKEIEGKFNGNVFFIPISKTPNLVDIIQRMALRVGFKETTIESEDQAVLHLQQLLKRMGQRPLLLVLDDVWSNSEPLLDKFVVSTLPDYKILVTSRFEFSGFGDSHRLRPLNSKESMELFHRIAIVEGGRFRKPDKQVLEQLVNACKGLPLALTIVGKSLRAQPSSKWESKRDELCKGNSVIGLNDEILNCLKKSLDDFDSDHVVKECFLDLSSFREDSKIPAAALIDMWIELYNLDTDAHAITILHKLSERSLTDLIIPRKDADENDGCYDGYQVMVHDLLRDLAIMESNRGMLEERKRLIVEISENQFPDWWIEQNPMQVNAHLASISTGGAFVSSWPNLDLPQAEVLLLNFGTRSYSLPDFIQKMDNLKSLLVINHCFYTAELSNFDRVFSLSNLKRIRLERIKVPLFSTSNVPLHNLKKLSLFMCNISQSLMSCETQISSLMPSLVELNIDYCNDLVKLPAGLCELVHLRKLSITNCHMLSDLPERVGNLERLEIMRLNSCTNLSELPDSIGNLRSLTFLDISDCLRVKKFPDRMGQLVSLRKLYVRGCLSLDSLPSSMTRLRNLRKVICDEEKARLFESLKKNASSLSNNLVIDVAKEQISLDWLFD